MTDDLQSKIGTHFAAPCSGHLVVDGNGYRFDAVAPGDA